MRKRRIAAFVGTTALLVSGVTAAYAAGSTPGWRQADVGAARSRDNTSETVLKASTIQSVVWKRMFPAPPINAVNVHDFDLDCSAEVALPPVALGTSLYTVIAGSITAVNDATGAALWSTPPVTPDTQYTGLAVVGNVVYAGSLDCVSESDPGGRLEARNAGTGALMWAVSTSNGSLFTMVVSAGHVVVDGFQAGSSNGGATVFNATTGASQWTNQNCTNEFTAIVVGAVAIMGGCDSALNPTLEGRALATGHLMWSRPGDWQPQRGDSDTAGGHDAYALDPAGHLVDLNPLTGATRWTASIGSALAVDATRVYTQCSPSSVCAYTRTGPPALVWTHSTDQGPVSVAGPLAYMPDGNVLVAASGELASNGPLWIGTAKWVAVAAGRVLAVVDPRIVDVYSQ